jgi:hypothetical protein
MITEQIIGGFIGLLVGLVMVIIITQFKKK